MNTGTTSWLENLSLRFQRLMIRLFPLLQGPPGATGSTGERGLPGERGLSGISAMHAFHLGNPKVPNRILNPDGVRISGREIDILGRISVTGAEVHSVNIIGRDSYGELQVSVDCTDTSAFRYTDVALNIRRR